MNKKTYPLLVALAFAPLIAFSQPAAPPTSPNPPTPPVPPVNGFRDREPKVPVTFLGVETSEIPSVLCDQLGLPKGFGLVVDYVSPDGPAAAGGVQQNDVLKMFNDQILVTPTQLARLVRSNQEGAGVTLTLMRKGKEEKVSVKLGKKDVPRRQAEGGHSMGHSWNFDMGDLNFGELGDAMREQVEQMKKQIPDQGVIHDAVARARDEVRRAAEQARQAAQQMRTFAYSTNGGLQRTTIDMKNAQIVLSDDKGELRVENVDGKKMLTAKDPQGKLLFSGPVETKEDIDKVPAEVRQRFEKLQQRDLPAMSPQDPVRPNEIDNDDDAATPPITSVSYEQAGSARSSYRGVSGRLSLL